MAPSGWSGEDTQCGVPEIWLCSYSLHLESIDINLLLFPLILDMKTYKPPSWIEYCVHPHHK